MTNYLVIIRHPINGNFNLDFRYLTSPRSFAFNPSLYSLNVLKSVETDTSRSSFDGIYKFENLVFASYLIINEIFIDTNSEPDG